MAQRSPFPGMDPWLEKHWGDLHHRIVQYGCDQIAARLPAGLFASVEETVHVFDTGESVGHLRPDVALLEHNPNRGSPERATAAAGIAVATPAPVRIRWPRQPIVEGHIEIRSVGGGEPLVTAIEIISPTNKVHSVGRRAYTRKREAYYEAGVNVVEIDLLREGKPLIDVPWDLLSDEQLTLYCACVRRAAAAEADLDVDYYPMPLRQRLPPIAIPLRPSDADVTFDLQACIDRAYEMGGYALRLDYIKDPTPPLTPEDAAWARDALATAQSTSATL